MRGYLGEKEKPRYGRQSIRSLGKKETKIGKESMSIEFDITVICMC